MPKNLGLSFLLDFYGDVLTDKQREVMEQYYNDDLSLAEIAENFGITRQGVRDSIKRGECILLDLEDKVGFAAKYRMIQDKMDEIEQQVHHIEGRMITGYHRDEQIVDSARQILKITNEVKDC